MNKNLNELLKQIFNATDEQISSFADAMKTNGIYTASQESLDIRYDKLKQESAATAQERDAANNTIAELKKAAEGQANMQGIITKQEDTIKKLTEELNQTKVNSAVKVALLSENVVDVDYMTYKLNEKLKGNNETLSLDDNGNIKGWSETVEGLKTQFPTMFKAQDTNTNKDGYEVVDPLALRKGNGADAPTPEAFKKMSYEERLALKQNNEAQYNALRKQIRGNE